MWTFPALQLVMVEERQKGGDRILSQGSRKFGSQMSRMGQKATSPQLSGMSALLLPAQPVDATQALNLSAGVSNCKVSRGRSLS
jgi:hypothetical protein